MMTTLIDYLYFIFGIHSLLLIVIGTPLNLLCFYIFKYKIPNRSNSTIIVFSYLAVIELIIPLTWNLNYVIRELVWKYKKDVSIKNLEQYSLFVCKLISYAAYFSLQCAAWLKTLASFTRCVSLHQEWSIRNQMLKSNTIHHMSLIIIFIISLINLPILIINGQNTHFIDKNNQTAIKVRCYQSVFFQFWEIAHLLLYNFIPFTLMILCNILIIRQVRASRRRTRTSRISSNASMKQSFSKNLSRRASISSNGGRLTKTLLFIAVFFIVFTSPSAIFYIFLGKRIKSHRNLITMGLSNLATTSHISSFIIYWLTSIDFSHAVIRLFDCRSNNNRRTTIDDKQKEKNVSIGLTTSNRRMSYVETQMQTTVLQP